MEEWRNALRSPGRCGKKTIARIRRMCPGHREVTGRSFKGFYYRVSKNRVVFVVTPPTTIITVFELPKA